MTIEYLQNIHAQPSSDEQRLNAQQAKALSLLKEFAVKRPDEYAKMICSSATKDLYVNALSTTYNLAGIEARTSRNLGIKSTVFPAEVKAPEQKIERPEQNRTNIPLLKG